ncbi:unnamed protein product, partial [marine sediment metagenome]
CSFVGLTDDGQPAVVRTKGNRDTCVVLRGSYENGPNDADASKAVEALAAAKLTEAVIIDAAHGNSGKTVSGQVAAISRITGQLGTGACRGIMVESFLEEGRCGSKDEARGRGISVTDPCLGWQKTEEALYLLNEAARVAQLPKRGDE